MFALLLFSRYFSPRIRPSLPTETLGVVSWSNKAFSCLHHFYTRGWGSQKLKKKEAQMFTFQLFYDTDFPRSWHSLCAEICENKDNKTEHGRVRPGCNACSHFGVERELYGDWKPLPLVWNYVTRRKCFTKKQNNFLAESAWKKKFTSNKVTR